MCQGTVWSNVFTACVRETKCPSVLKEAQVVPVYRKNSRTDPKNHRLISFLLVVGKVFENI